LIAKRSSTVFWKRNERSIFARGEPRPRRSEELHFPRQSRCRRPVDFAHSREMRVACPAAGHWKRPFRYFIPGFEVFQSATTSSFINQRTMASQSSGFFTERGIFLNCLIDFLRVWHSHLAKGIIELTYGLQGHHSACRWKNYNQQWQAHRS